MLRWMLAAVSCGAHEDGHGPGPGGCGRLGSVLPGVHAMGWGGFSQEHKKASNWYRLNWDKHCAKKKKKKKS